MPTDIDIYSQLLREPLPLATRINILGLYRLSRRMGNKPLPAVDILIDVWTSIVYDFYAEQDVDIRRARRELVYIREMLRPVAAEWAARDEAGHDIWYDIQAALAAARDARPHR